MEFLLDQSVVEALKLETFGRSTEATAGTYTASRAILPKLTLGAVELNDVEIMAAPYVDWSDAKTPVAGLFGFDFLAGCVVAIDYEGGTVDAIDPNTFTPPAGAVALPIRLDDGVPAIAARIGAATGSSFILDTGADRSMLFSDFVTAHPEETSDQGLGSAMLASFPFLEKMSGVGGRVTVRPVQVADFGLGSVTFPRWFFYATAAEARAFEGEDYDGLIGQDVLRNFVVYLDYRHRQIYLVPNERFRQRYG